MLTQHEALAVSLAVLVALMTATLAVIAGIGAPSTRPAVQGSAPAPACAEWTDGCVICRRTAQGLACSTPGIACTPVKPRCVTP